MIPSAKEALMGSGILLAAVAGAFPSGRSSLAIKLSEVEWALSLGADEIDMVIDRGAFLAGHLGQVYDEIVAIKSVCGKRRLKVILETGELITYDNIKRASWLALLAGADFIKTSTGKAVINATPGAALVMLEAVRDFTEQSGNRVGVKVAGGIRSTRDATRYLVIVDETVGSAWMTPEYFRFGASSLLTDLVMQRHHLATGIYLRLDNFSLD
jgi:deoxyribose-phosphate aldolase